MLNSLSSFTTLFRHVLLEMGEPGRKHSREAVGELAHRMNFDPAPFVQIMDVRAQDGRPETASRGRDCEQVFAGHRAGDRGSGYNAEFRAIKAA